MRRPSSAAPQRPSPAPRHPTWTPCAPCNGGRRSMPTMPPGRKAKNRDLPPRLHLSDGAYYYVTTTKPRKWIRLSKDKAEALLKWAQLEGQKAPADATTFDAAWKRYEREVVPKKALRTQSDNRKESAFLIAVFGAMQLDAITAKHVEDYMEARAAKV